MVQTFDKLFEQQVAALCAERGSYVTYTTGGVDYFVKRGCPSLRSEARTQDYVFELSLSDLNAPRVPKVHHIFYDGHGYTYLIMEAIPAPTFGAWVDEAQLSPEERKLRLELATEKIAAAVSWLLACPIPEDNRIGPIGGGRIQHDFFNKEEAPREFLTALALENLVNKALSRFPPPTNFPKVSLSHEKLMLSPSDISLNNFLYDPPTGRVCMVDFQHVNVLPFSFVSFALHGSQYPFAQSVAKMVDLALSPHITLLRHAAGHILQCGNSALGLDGYGNPKRSARRPATSRSRPKTKR